MPIEVGVQAPDFVLKDQNNQDVRLSDFRGKQYVLLVFYPLAFTGVCTGELCQVRDNLNDFVNDRVQLLSVSVDSAYSHKVWAEQKLRLWLQQQTARATLADKPWSILTDPKPGDKAKAWRAGTRIPLSPSTGLPASRFTPCSGVPRVTSGASPP